jgi:methyl-accepting chemotaxis protein
VAGVIESKGFDFADFEQYEPSDNAPAAFIAQPVLHEDDVELIVALKLPLDAINNVMHERTGMGVTGESYLVGPDKLMRSDSFRSPGSHSVMASFAGNVENNGVDTVASREALVGKDGIGIITDYHGTSVLSAYSPLDVYGTTWAIITEQGEYEALSAVSNMLLTAALILLIASIVVGIIAFFIVVNIANPIILVTGLASRLGIGDAELEGVDQSEVDRINRRGDEIGAIGRAFSALVEYFKEMAAAAVRLAAGDLTAEVEPKAEVDTLGNAFSQMIDNLRNTVAQVAENAMNVNIASGDLASSADQAGNVTNQIAYTINMVASGIHEQTTSITITTETIENMTRAIDGVAKGAQEQASAVSRASTITSQLSGTIQQVAGNAQAVTQGSAEASEAAREGERTVEETIQGMEMIREKVQLSAQRVQEMGTRSQEIGVIVEAIEDIASQTNLLALNAAIEAARAGEHGKGFAVVAEEVRKLAERASVSTQEIGELIRDIQRTVGEAVTAMDEGTKEVESGVGRANQAGKALEAILQAAEGVYRQAEQAGAASEEMSAAAEELVGAIDSVSAIVEENTAASEEMAVSSSDVVDAFEGISAISLKNAASTEEVSAGTEEMSAQVEEVSASAQSLSDLAEDLHEIISHFKLIEDEVDGSEDEDEPEPQQLVDESLH